MIQPQLTNSARPSSQQLASIRPAFRSVPRGTAAAACAPFFCSAARLATLDADQREAMTDAVMKLVSIDNGRFFALQAARRNCVQVMAAGWAYRYKTLSNGARQVTDILLPGDIVDWGIAGDDERDDLRACGPACVALLRREAMSAPDGGALDRVLELVRYAEARRLRDRLVSLGRRSARARIAHLIAEFYDRLHGAGLAQGGTFDCPLTQELLADALGLTPVHINRMLQALRHDGVIVLTRPAVSIPDLARLHAVAGFSVDLATGHGG